MCAAAMLGSTASAAVFVLLVASVCCASEDSGTKPKKVYFGGFFPMENDQYRGDGIMSAINLAIRHINESPDILPDYELNMLWNDTKCKPGVALKSFFDMIHQKPQKMFLYGASCSPVTDQIAKAARHWNLVQISYADSHPMFTEKSYPHFFRIVQSENEYNPPRLSLLKYFNWTRVGTLYQNLAKYTLAHNNLILELEKNKFEVVESQSFNDEITNQLEILRDKDIRIILANFNETWARRVFCNAYHHGLYGRKFQWVIVGGMYKEGWWKTLDKEEAINCTTHQMTAAVSGVIVTSPTPISSDEDITISKLTPSEYELEYKKDSATYSRFHGYAYDGVWALALAMQYVDHKVKARGETLLDFNYKNSTWQNLLIEALDRTSFEGVTGPVRFKDNSRRGNILIKQIVAPQTEHAGAGQVSGDSEGELKASGLDERCIGEYSGVTRTLHLEKCEKIQWVKNRPPKDRTFKLNVQTRVNTTLYIIIVVVASLGILIATVFLGINIKFRNKREIKMSSPNMNNLIIIGCILTYTSVILLGLDSHLTSVTTFPYICTARAWILMSGFTLSFGSMFSKTWRVHSIFTNVQLNKKVMKDYQLYLVVGALVVIDIITLTTWQVVDPFYRDTKKLRPYFSENDETEIIPEIESCRSEYMTIFVGCTYAYKGVLMLFGAFLAWETRQVQIPALNDSKYVGMSVYNVAIMCILGVAVTFVLKDEQTASFVIISVFIIFCTTLTLCLVFVPKLIELKRNRGNSMKNAGKVTMKVSAVANLKDKPIQTIDDMLRIAERVNTKLKCSLQELEKDITSCQALIDNAEKEAIDNAKETTGLRPTILPKAEDLSGQGRNNGGIPNQQHLVANDNRHHVTQGDQRKPEKPTCLQLSYVNARQSTTSTITSDYFSMNSREAEANRKNREDDATMDVRRYVDDAGYSLKPQDPTNNNDTENNNGNDGTASPAPPDKHFEDQATQTEDEDDFGDDDSYCSYNEYSGCPYPDCPSHTQSHEELSPHYDLIDSSAKEGGGGGGGGRRSRGPYNTNSLKLRGKSLGDNVFLDDGDPNLAYYESSVQMLPIFQRLIEDKRGCDPGGGGGGGVSGKGSKGAFKTKSANAASCPNISLRCDIVEYL